ncbi:MAG: S24/S26 family peptidase [Clostridia bacterium]|nr:S24/S26 family peptidase [Clostridia bacterium]
MNNPSTFEQQLDEHGRIIYTNVGDSMMPFIKQGRDVLVIEKREGALKKYDVPLYKRPSGQYVLHRIHKVTDKGYVTCGDNRASRERYVLPEQVIGVLTAVIRDGREIADKSFAFKLYAHLGCDGYFIRFALGKIRALFRRIFSKKH